MNPGHEDCTHEAVDEGTIADPGWTRVVCHHDHREPVYASDGVLEHAVGFYCHCCGRVWSDHA